MTKFDGGVCENFLENSAKKCADPRDPDVTVYLYHAN
jgi:hypothetical protein